MLVLVVYFSLFLGSRALNVPDEGRYSEIAREMLSSRDFITPTLDHVVFFHKPILFYWLQSLSFAAFGINEWSVRLMPALFGVLGCVLTYITAVLVHGRRAGIIAVLALATNPLYYLSSHYANLDLEVAVLISGALFGFMLALRHPMGPARRNLMWLAYAFAALATLTKGLIGIVLPALVIGAWIVLRGEWRVLRQMYLPSGLLLFCVIALPWYVAVQLRNPGFFHFFFVEQHFARYTAAGFNNAQPWWFYLPVLLVGFFPWIAILIPAAWAEVRRAAARGGGEGASKGFALFLLLWILLITGFFSVPVSKLVGYILPVLPAMALVTGIYASDRLARLSINRDDRFRTLYAVAAIGLTLALLVVAGTRFVPAKYQSAGPQLYLAALAATLIIGALMTYWLARTARAVQGLSTVGATGAAAALVLLLLAGQYPIHSTRPLAAMVRPTLQPQDEIVSFGAFYFDLGLYLNPARPIDVVNDWDDPAILQKDNWKSDLYFGIRRAPDSRRWMVNEAEFAAMLKADRTFYVFADTNDIERLRRDYGLHLRAEANGVALLTSRPLAERP
jgi:4-amino-4-deoxy-L-arabinose transferase-like glycosyltransferase